MAPPFATWLRLSRRRAMTSARGAAAMDAPNISGTESRAVGRFPGSGHRAWMRNRAQGLIEGRHWLGDQVSPGAAGTVQ
jgi:hypothetical protein